MASILLISQSTTFIHPFFVDGISKIADLARRVLRLAYTPLFHVASFFSNLVFSKNKVAANPINPLIQKGLAKKPQAIFVFGGPGAGKNSYIDKFCSGEGFKSFTIIDADLEMEKIPGYIEAIRNKEKDAADCYHHEALRLRGDLFDKTKKNLGDFIFVGSGAHLEFYKTILTSLKSSYHIKTVFIEISLENALARAHARGELTGRIVPEKVIRSNHTDAEKNFAILKKIAHCFEVYSNNDQMKLKNQDT